MKHFQNLKKECSFLLKGGVFNKHFIDTWIKFKYEKEIKKVLPVPSPIEFQLYYDL